MRAIEKSAGGALRASGANLVDSFLEALDAAPKTRETYRRSLRRWCAWLGSIGEDVMGADRQTVLTWKEELLATRKPATANAYLSAVRQLYAWTESRGIKPNIAAGVKGARRSQNSPKDALTVEQARGILADTPEEGATLSELRDYALVNLLMRRGLRTVEAARANIGDIRQVNGQAVLYLQGKGFSDKSDFIILNSPCLEPLYAYLEARGCKDKDAPLFAGHGNRNEGGRLTTRSISRIAKQAMKSHGADAASLTAHSLRHTAVTFALIGGAPLQEVQAMARHRSINTTMIYAHNLHRMEAGAEHAVDALLAG